MAVGLSMIAWPLLLLAFVAWILGRLFPGLAVEQGQAPRPLARNTSAALSHVFLFCVALRGGKGLGARGTPAATRAEGVVILRRQMMQMACCLALLPLRGAAAQAYPTRPIPLVNATLYENLPYNFIRDIAPVAALIDYPSVMVVHPSVSTRTVAEFLAYAKANPGKLAMSSAGNGSVGHLSGELLRMMTGVELQHVPYRGNAPALADLLSGQVAVTFASSASATGYVKSGKLRALAVTSATRSEAMPEVPAMAEVVPGFEVASWYGIAAPRATPAGVIDRLNKEVNGALADPDMKARLAELGGMVIPGSPAYFASLIANDTDKWAKVIKFAGVKLT